MKSPELLQPKETSLECEEGPEENRHPAEASRERALSLQLEPLGLALKIHICRRAGAFSNLFNNLIIKVYSIPIWTAD